MKLLYLTLTINTSHSLRTTTELFLIGSVFNKPDGIDKHSSKRYFLVLNFILFYKIH